MGEIAGFVSCVFFSGAKVGQPLGGEEGGTNEIDFDAAEQLGNAGFDGEADIGVGQQEIAMGVGMVDSLAFDFGVKKSGFEGVEAEKLLVRPCYLCGETSFGVGVDGGFGWRELG